MSFYKIKAPNAEEFALEHIDAKLLIPSSQPNQAVYFSNGDKMTIDLETGVMEWEPIKPGAPFTSKLSMRLHQWYAKGLIAEIKEREDKA